MQDGLDSATAPATVSSLLNHESNGSAFKMMLPTPAFAGASPNAPAPAHAGQGPMDHTGKPAGGPPAQTFASALQAGQFGMLWNGGGGGMNVPHHFVPQGSYMDKEGAGQPVMQGAHGGNMMAVPMIFAMQPYHYPHSVVSDGQHAGQPQFFCSPADAQHHHQLLFSHGQHYGVQPGQLSRYPGDTGAISAGHNTATAARPDYESVRYSQPHSGGHATIAQPTEATSSPEPKDDDEGGMGDARPVHDLGRRVVEWARQNTGAKIASRGEGSSGTACPVELVFPRRGRKSGGADNKGRTHEPILITMEVMMSLFHLPLVQASKRLGLSPTAIKSVCRRLGIKKWPFRALSAKSTRRNRKREGVKSMDGGSGSECKEQDPQMDAAVTGLSLLSQAAAEVKA